MRRREFIALTAGAWSFRPIAAAAQRPVAASIGFLHSTTSRLSGAPFRQGLLDQGFVEGHNIRIEELGANGAYDRLPELAARLAERDVTLFAAFGTPAAHAATIQSRRRSPPHPVVFSIAGDPVSEGLVESLNRPGANVSGVTSISSELAPKRLDLMRGFFRPRASIGLLINPGNPLSPSERASAEAASRATGQPLEVFTASSRAEIENSFARLRQLEISILIVAADVFFYQQPELISRLAAAAGVPMIGPRREFAAQGGLLSYGASVSEVNRLAGVMVGRILKGEKPADLPVQQPTRFELVINLKTAKALGIEMPATLLALADEVIE